MLDVLGALIPDPGLTHELDSVERFNHLCKLFSSKDRQLRWQNSKEKQEIRANTDLALTFFMNNKKAFEWQFLPGHFSFGTLANEAKWQDKFGDSLLTRLQTQPTYPQLTFYLNERKALSLLDPSMPFFLTLAYGHLGTEEGLKAVIKSIFKNKSRENYGWGEALMKRLPTQDERIQLFILDALLYDKEELSKIGSGWIKEQLGKEAELIKKVDLFYAANNGCLNLLKHRLGLDAEEGIKNRVNNKDYRGTNTLLTHAAFEGHIEVVQFLIAQGADIDARVDTGHTAFMQAASGGHHEILKFLIEKGANIEADNGRDTALSYSAKSGHLAVVKFLLEKGASLEVRNKALESAASGGHLAVVIFLSEKGSSLEVRNRALWQAAYGGHLDVVTFLSEKGASCQVADEEGQTALSIAAQSGHLDIVKCLLGKGASLEAVDNYGGTALIRACRTGRFEVVAFLLKEGASCEVRDKDKIEDGKSALYYAVDMSNKEVAELLVDNGAKIIKKWGINTDFHYMGPYLTEVQTYLKYPHQFKDPALNQFETPYDYFDWAVKAVVDPPPEDFPKFPKQAVVIGLLETLMGKHFPIDEKSPAEGKIAVDILRAISTVAAHTDDNALTDQVWRGLGHKVSGKIQRHRLAVYILQTYARTKDPKVTEEVISKTDSPLFKDISSEQRKEYTQIAIKKYGDHLAEMWCD